MNADAFYFFELHPTYDQTQGSSVVFLPLKIILLYIFNNNLLAKSYELVVGVCFDNLFFVMGHLASLSSKNYKISPPQIKVTCFTLLCVYIVLHTHVKSYKYKYINMYIFLLDHVKLFIYTLTQSVSPNPNHFTCTTLDRT